MLVLTDDPKELIRYVVEVLDDYEGNVIAVHDSEECEKELKEWIKLQLEKVQQLM